MIVLTVFFCIQGPTGQRHIDVQELPRLGCALYEVVGALESTLLDIRRLVPRRSCRDDPRAACSVIPNDIWNRWGRALYRTFAQWITASLVLG